LGPFVGAPGLGTVAHKMLQAIPRFNARTQEIIYDTEKMAGEVSEDIENGLNIIVSTTERSGNMNKELKQTIFETLSTLMNLFVKLKDGRDGKSIVISELERRVTKMKAELEECRGKNIKVHGAPSPILSQEPGWLIPKGMAPSHLREGKLYSEALGGEKNLKRFKLFVRYAENQSPETIKGLLKSKINPTEISGNQHFQVTQKWESANLNN
jgi:hypothetical protein